MKRIITLIAALAAVASIAPACAAPVQWKHLSSTAGQVPKPDLGRQVASLILDVDGDGVSDFVVASYEKMAWFRRAKEGWTRLPVESGAPGVRMEAGGDSLDIDGDGDLDILMGAQSRAGEIWWWENPRPNYAAGTPWKRHPAMAVGGTHHDQIFGDFDGDGKAELVFWYNGGKQLFLAEIPADPTKPWEPVEIARLPQGPNPEGLAKIDVDGDGKLDIVGGGYWFKHQGGTRFEASPIDADYRFARCAAGDLVKGGRPEVLIGSGDGVGPLNLYEWKEGAWAKRALIDKMDHGHTLQVGDLNGDGNLDIYAAEMHTPGSGAQCRQWVLYGDGKGAFETQILSTGIGTHEAKIGDLDGDGDLDILQKDFQADQRVDVWLNEGPAPRFAFRHHVIDTTLTGGSFAQTAAVDLDGDGRPEFVMGQTGGNVWAYRYQAPDRWTRTVVGERSPSDVGLCVLDVDRDGRPDLVAGGAWYRNTGDLSKPFERILFDAELRAVHDLAAADVNGDGRADVLSMSDKNTLRWYRIPADPRQPWERRDIGKPVHAGLSVGDLDGDGDLDVVRTNVWFENVKGDGSEWSEHPIGPNTPPPPDFRPSFAFDATRSVVCDMNGDGKNDIVFTDGEIPGGKVWWMENADGKGRQWTRRDVPLGDEVRRGAYHALQVLDLDRDGDLDIFSCEMEAVRGAGKPRWYVWENLDGKGGAWKEHVVLDANLGGHEAVIADFTGDGLPDIISKPWRPHKENAVGGKPFVVFLENVWGKVLPPIPPTPTASAPAPAAAPAAPAPSTSAAPTAGAPAPHPTAPPSARPTFTPVEAGAAGILAHWKLDAATGESIGKAAACHGAVLQPEGRLGGALRFDGKDDYVDAGPMDVPGSALALAAWFRAERFDHLGSRDARILSKATGTAEQDHFWMLSAWRVGGAARLRFRLKAGGTTTTLIASSGDLKPGVWMHAAATYDGATMRLYLDGREVGAMPKTGAVDADAKVPAWIGGNPPEPGSRPWCGLLDDVSVHARALSEEDVRALAEGK